MKRFSHILVKIGLLLIGASVVMYLVFFYPVVFQELKYFFMPAKEDIRITTRDKWGQDNKYAGKSNDGLVPADENFSIIIPKIGANSKVMANVDPYDSAVYQKALTQGVAHAEGSAFPGQIGNTFLFSHSSVNFLEADTFNAVFYVLTKLEKDDVFYIVYKGEVFKYVVSAKMVVNPEEVEYIGGVGGLEGESGSTATLMTCWPAGTNLKRLVVLGKLTENK